MKNTFTYAVLLFTVTSALTAVEWQPGATGDWGDNTSWVGTEPTASEPAFLRSGTQVANVTQPGEVASRLNLGQGSGSSATLNITSGSLNLSGDGQLRVSYYGGSTGIVNLSGGTLTAKAYEVGVNSASSVAELNISGTGYFDLNGHFNQANIGFNGATNKVTLTGSDARLDVSNAFNLADYSTLEITLDAGGAPTLNVNRLSSVSANAELVIDFGSYEYSGSGTDKITIVNAAIFGVGGVFTFFDANNISYLNDSDVSYELVTDDLNSGEIYINVTGVPEPSSYALVGGLLALIWVVVARRRC